jgi:hypothetical protein
MLSPLMVKRINEVPSIGPTLEQTLRDAGIEWVVCSVSGDSFVFTTRHWKAVLIKKALEAFEGV